MSFRVWMLICVVVAAGDVAAADLTVLPLGGRAPASTRLEITEALRAEITGLGFNVQSKAATAQVLADAEAFGNQCSVTVTACAIQMGSLAGARTVVTGVVDDGQLSIRAIDVASEREIARAAVPIDLTAPAAAVGLAAVRLLRPGEEVGTLAMVVDVIGAAVSIDGVPRGVSPLPSIPLTPGRHEVFVSHVEHDSQTFVVDVALGRTTTLEVALRPDTPRPRPPREGMVPAPARVDDATPILVLDVVPSSPPQREHNVLAALLTESLVEELRRRRANPLTVATPTDVLRFMGADGPQRLAACAVDDDTCLVTTVERSFPRGELVLVSLVRLPGKQVRLNASRNTLGSSARLTTEITGTPEDIVTAAPWLIGQLFSELDPAAVDDERAQVLVRRLLSKPVSLPVFLATAGGVAVGAAVGVGSFVGYANAGDDPTATVAWGVGMVGGAVVAAGCLTSAIIESVFVDWHGDTSANDELLADVATRPYSSR